MLFLVITLIPMLVVANYSHASADDFGWGAGGRRQVWNETHSILEFLKVAAQDTANIYNGWQGTFATTFVQAFQPEIFNIHAYFIVPYIMLSFFLGSTAFLLYYILVKMMKMKKSIFVIVSAIYFLIAIQYIPSIGEAFYWYNGAVAYTMAYSVMLFCICFSLKFIFGGKKADFIMAVTTAFFVGGGNYLTVVLLPLLLTVLLFLFKAVRRRTLYLLVPLTVFGVTAVINMKAPGTKVRGGSEFGFDIHRVFYTIGRAAYQGLKDVRSDYMNNPVFVIGMIVIALFLASQILGREYEFSFKYPILFVSMTFGSYLAMYAPTYYAGVGKPFGRMANLISFYFGLSMIIDMIYVFGWIGRKWNERWGDKFKFFIEKWNKYKIYFLLAIIFLIIVNQRWYAATAMVHTVNYLTSGEAQEFKEAMDERYEILLDEELKDVELELLPSAGPLFNYDIVEDWDKWPNTAVAEFFNKDKVSLKRQ